MGVFNFYEKFALVALLLLPRYIVVANDLIKRQKVSSELRSLQLNSSNNTFHSRPIQQSSPFDDRDVVKFYVMGDFPYGVDERNDFSRQINQLANDTEFIVHVGDIKRSSEECVSFFYNNTATELKKASSTVFIIPGDNDWIACDNITSGVGLWKQSFHEFHKNWGNRTMFASDIKLQPSSPENFSFIHKGVLFIGINLINDFSNATYWDEMAVNDVEWLVKNVLDQKNATAVVIFTHVPPKKKYSAFFAPLNKLAAVSELQFLLVHGNGHKWIKDRPFTSTNILRVQVARGKLEDPLEVSIKTRVNKTSESKDEPFSFIRRFAPTVSPTQLPTYHPSGSLTFAPIWSVLLGTG